MQVIETRYKGYRFRSRLEARWAVFFDALGLKWEYEKEGFKLKREGCYLPDFWLEDLGIWLEVKPGNADHLYPKAQALFEEHGAPVAIANGLPGERLSVWVFDATDGSAGYSQWEGCTWGYDAHGKVVINTHDTRSHRDYYTFNVEPVNSIVGDHYVLLNMPEGMFNVAKSARFEHGEKGEEKQYCA